jgi:hypothetical protein
MIGSGPRAASTSSCNSEITLTLLKSTRVTVGNGLQVLDVATSFESSEILVGNLPLNMSASVVRNMVSRLGEVRNVETWTTLPSTHSQARVSFSSSSEAASAIESLNGSKQPFGTIVAHPYHQERPSEVGRLSACILRLDIPAPGAIGYLGFETQDEAIDIAKKIHGTTLKNHVVSARLNYGLPKAGPFTVKFEGIPPATAEKTLRSFSKRPIMEGGLMIADAKYKSLADITNLLKRYLEEHGSLIHLKFPPVLPTNGRIRGIARFASAESAASARFHLNGRKYAFLGHERIYVHHLHKMAYKVPNPLRQALRFELMRLTDFARGQPGVQLSWNANDTAQSEISISASDLGSLKRVKTPLERLLAGEILKEGDTPVWDKFFTTSEGHEFLEETSVKARSRIRFDRLRCIIKAWGSEASRRQARILILTKIKSLRESQCFSLPLSGRVLMELLFDNLDDINEKVGCGNATLDFEERKFVVRGTKDQFEWVVESLAQKYGSIMKPPNTKRMPIGSCIICMDEATGAIKLDCGHKACKICLTRYISASGEHRMFPLKCLGDDNKCPELLPLHLCQKLIEKETFAQLVEASFLSYIHSRPEEFHYCPTPDCPQIYRMSACGSTIQCPTCLVRICAACHAVEHEGVACTVSAAASERLFEEWKEQNNVKSCPACTSVIEKAEGCNHVMCARCSTHICWACMARFKESGDVYEHMNKVHGGIGL